jgi:hypothetical protein
VLKQSLPLTFSGLIYARCPERDGFLQKVT